MFDSLQGRIIPWDDRPCPVWLAIHPHTGSVAHLDVTRDPRTQAEYREDEATSPTLECDDHVYAAQLHVFDQPAAAHAWRLLAAQTFASLGIPARSPARPANPIAERWVDIGPRDDSFIWTGPDNLTVVILNFYGPFDCPRAVTVHDHR